VASAEHGRASVDRQEELAINRYAIALVASEHLDRAVAAACTIGSGV
jgi:hypothetical protein